jgi:hypothetical protein
MNPSIKFACLSAVTLLQAGQAIILFWVGDRPSALIFFGFAISGVGLIWTLA